MWLAANKHELFEVTRVDDDKTEVVVYKVTKEGERRQEVFRRMVHHAETKETTTCMGLLAMIGL